MKRAFDERIVLAVDIGGTFTDAVLSKGGDIFVEKTLTTPDDLLRGFFTGVGAVMRKACVSPADVNGAIVHATTLVTNALIERKGARTEMVFTRGFADILEIRDERRYDMYDSQIEFPVPLVTAEDVFTVDERVLADGSIEKELDEVDIDALCDRILEKDIKTVGVCFLHSYKNAHNERRLGEELRRRLPSVFVSLSSEVAPQIREYLRASTTAVNAYAIPITQPYLAALEARLREKGFPSKPLIMLSSGGVVGSSTAARMPVRMIESGPAAGALGGVFAARSLDLLDVLAFDMGGTTAKICLIRNFQPLITGLFEIDRVYRFKEGSGLPVSVPTIDLIEIGSGGGSIASLNELGLLNVGPRSAGAFPGPACYGLGGNEPTVTDADVVLGLIDPDKFLGGAMRLDANASSKAVGKVAESLGTSVTAAARGIYRIVCETMASAARAHAADRGVDYRGIPILAFGGAGPVHACEVASLLRSNTVIFPPHASVFSSFGSLLTPPRLDLVRSGLTRIGKIDWTAVAALFDDMENESRTALIEAGTAEQNISYQYSADIRYVGQHYDVMVALGGRPEKASDAAVLRRAFEVEYEKRYRIIQSEVEVEVVNWRLTATGKPLARPTLTPGRSHGHGERTVRQVQLWHDDQLVAVAPRSSLGIEDTIAGPALIEEAETTIVIPPGWLASIGALGAIVARHIESNVGVHGRH